MECVVVSWGQNYNTQNILTIQGEYKYCYPSTTGSLTKSRMEYSLIEFNLPINSNSLLVLAS